MADFRIKIIVDSSRVPTGARPVARKLTSLENQAKRLGKTLTRVFGVLAAGRLLLASIRNIARFEEAMAVVRAVTKATGDEFVTLTDRAQQLGISTRFSATQAADAMVLLARAGFSVDETMESVAQTLLLAQAGSLGMAEAADITASALRGFGLETSETARITDVLTAAANRSNTNVSQLGQALKFVAPIAKGLGQTIEITTAALGALSDAGLKGTLAGTGLRRVLAELASPGRELADILRNAGLIAEDVDPQIAGLTNALEALKIAGFDTGDALEVFGQRGGPAFAVLVDNIPKVREMEIALLAAGGEAKDVADIMDDTLNGALFRLKSAFEGLNLAIGEAFASAIFRTIIEGITIALRGMAKHIEVVQAGFILLATVGVGAMVSLIPSIGVVTGKLFALAASAVNAKIALGGVSSAFFAIPLIPLLLAGVTIAAIVDGGRKITEEFTEARKTIDGIGKDKGLAQFGDQIVRTEKDLRRLKKTIASQKKTRDVDVSTAQIARVQELTETINQLRDASKNLRLESIENAAREERGAEATEAAISRLRRRGDVLAALTIEQKSSAAVQEELIRLEAQGAKPTEDEKNALFTEAKRNELLATRKRIFERIIGPMQLFKREEEAVNQLFDDGIISLDQLNDELERMEVALGKINEKEQVDPLKQINKEIEAMQTRLFLGEKQFALGEEVSRLAKDIDVNDTKQVAVILKKITLHEQLTAAVEKQVEAAKDDGTDLREERQLDRLARRINGMGALAEQAARLKVLFDSGRISLEQFNTEMIKLKITGLETSLALEAGFERAFLKIQLEAENLAAVGEKVVNVFADRLTEALQKAAEEGKLSFKDLARSILQDLQRILIRALIVQAITAALGGGVPVPGAGGGGPTGNVDFGFTPRAGGGPVQANRAFLVGEDGPEIFQPGQNGTIIPNGVAQQAPPLNVQIVNVQSEDDIPDVINEGGADDAIVNAIARNKDKVSQVLS